MFFRQVYQKRFFTCHQHLRWLCSSVSPPSTNGSANLTCSHFRNTASSYTYFERNVCYDLRRCGFSTQASIEGMVDVPLAQTGEGIAECELLKWFVQEGDQVEEFQPLCEVQSDKATIEITSRYTGKVSQILYVPGDIVKVKLVHQDQSLIEFSNIK